MDRVRQLVRAALVGVLLSPTFAYAAPTASEVVKPTVLRRDIAVAEARYYYFGSLGLKGRDGLADVTLRSHAVRLTFQYGHFFRRTGTLIGVALGYDSLQLQPGSGADNTSALSLHHLALRLVVGQRLHPKWMLNGFVRTGVASDFKGRYLAFSLGYLI